MITRPGGLVLLALTFSFVLTPAQGQQRYTIDSFAGQDFYNEGGPPLESRLNDVAGATASIVTANSPTR